ncbi:MAG: YdcF family protein [Leptolyngbya sp. BL-A-14]
MFLYLSKLLPLFFYPLGLTCVLLLVSLVLLWRRSRWTALPIVLSLLLLLGGSNGWVGEWLVHSLEVQHLPPALVPQADAIVILGGCTKPALPPRPWVEVSEAGDRVLYGAKLYREGKAPRIILSGGRINWKDGGPAESDDMAQLIETMGVPKSAILQDPTSLNTYENAVNVKQIMTAQGIRRILLVTSAIHMPRSLLIFKHLGIDAIAAPTDFTTTNRDWQELQGSTQAAVLNLLPEIDRLQHTTRALKEYLGLLVYRLKGWL